MDIAFLKRDTINYDIYIATGKDRYDYPRYGEGIYKDVSGGWIRIDTFSSVSKPLTYKLLTDTSFGQEIIYSATGSKVYRTKNGGATWEAIFELPNPQGRVIRDMEMKPDDPKTIYFVTTGIKDSLGLRPELYYTTNAYGALSNLDWDSVSLNGAYSDRMAIDVSLAEPNSLWLVYQDTKLHADTIHVLVLKKELINNPWDTLVNETQGGKGGIFGGVNIFRCELEVSNKHPVTIFVGGFYITRVIVNKTTGNSYFVNSNATVYEKDFHIDVRSLLCFLDKNNNETLFVGNDGGVSISYNYGVSLEYYNKEGLSIGQFYGLGLDQSDDNYFVAGSIDNGSYSSKNGQFRHISSGDTYDAIFFPKSEYSTVFTTGYNEVFGPWLLRDKDVGYYSHMYNDDTLGYQILKNEVLNAIVADRPIAIDPWNKDAVLIGYKNIIRCNLNSDYTKFKIDSGYTLPINTNSTVIESFKFAPSDKNILMVAYQNPTWDINIVGTKLFRSIDNGLSWSDISQNLNTIVLKGITDIAISSVNPNKIWVSFGGFGDFYSNANRVNYSEDGGQTWRDYSTGLTTYPVNKMICVEGSPFNDLYIATDVGVFHCNDLDTSWKRVGNIYDFPLAIVTDLEINYVTSKLFISTYGHGIWSTDIEIPCGTNLTHHIVSDTIWNSNLTFSNNITIDSGASLTINNILFMDEASTITIKKGGRLIVDGAKITSRCGLWGGIVVEGDPTLSQFPIANQGYVRLHNGANIENAEVAILCQSQPNSLTTVSYPEGGGIVRVDNATFRNNVYGIVMEPYLDKNTNGFIKPQISYIHNAHFVTDVAFANDTQVPEQFIHLNQVAKINILSCSFENTLATNASNYLQKGVGIYSLNSSFKVDTYMNGDSSLFSGLSCGIYASNSLSSATFKVNNAQFEQNIRGVEILAVNSTTITQNTFTMPNSPGNNFVPAGLMLNQCHSGYKIEGNSFIGDSTSVGLNVGLVIDNSGPQTNFVYRNTFSNSLVNAIAQGNNKDINDDESGLQYRCNTFNGAPNTQAVTNVQPNEGIAYYQGFYKSLPGVSIVQLTNNFFNNLHTSNVSQIYNQGDGFKYIYHFDQPLPPDSSEVSLNVYLTPKQDQFDTNSCPSTIINQSGTVSMQANALAYKLNMQTVAQVISQLVDRGDTENMLWNIETSEPSEAYDLMLELMNESPYLSEQVLIETAQNEDILNAAMVTQVMTANPHASRSEEVWDALLNRQITPLTSYMLNAIVANINVSSPKEDLENEMAYYQSQYQWYFDEINRKLHSDTLDWPVDSLTWFYSGDSSAMADFLFFEHQISLQNWEEAQNILSNISNSYTLDEASTDRYNEAVSLLNLMMEIKDSNLKELDDPTKNLLRQMAENEENTYRMAAQSLVNQMDDNLYFGAVYLPQGWQQRRPKTETAPLAIEKQNQLKVYPNPANDYITIEFEIEEVLNGAVLRIYNQQGQLVESMDINQNQAYKLIQTSNWGAGLYNVVLLNGNKVIKATQVSIISQ